MFFHSPLSPFFPPSLLDDTQKNGGQVYGEWLGSAVGRYLELISMTWSGSSFEGPGGGSYDIDGLELSGRFVAPLLQVSSFFQLFSREGQNMYRSLARSLESLSVCLYQVV